MIFLLTLGLTAEPESGQKKDRENGRKNFRKGEFAAHFFSRLDTNEDGGVNQEEFAANPRLERATAEQRTVLFNRLDKNSDGVIKPDELKAPKGMRPGERPPWLQNGPVNFEQFSEQPRVQRLSEDMRRTLFERLDQNKDGILSKADMPPRGRGDRSERKLKGPPPFKNLDLNSDDKVSFPEFQNAPYHRSLSEDQAEDRFEGLDLNSDGFLSREEHLAGSQRKQEDSPRKREQ